MMMWYGGDWGWGGWDLMTVAMVVFWALVITAVVLAVRYLAGRAAPPQARPVPGGRAPRACSQNASLAARSTRTSIDSACRYYANTRDRIGCSAIQPMVS